MFIICQKKSKKEEIVKKLNVLIKMLKDEGMSSSLDESIETSPTNSRE